MTITTAMTPPIPAALANATGRAPTAADAGVVGGWQAGPEVTARAASNLAAYRRNVRNRAG